MNDDSEQAKRSTARRLTLPEGEGPFFVDISSGSVELAARDAEHAARVVLFAWAGQVAIKNAGPSWLLLTSAQVPDQAPIPLAPGASALVEMVGGKLQALRI